MTLCLLLILTERYIQSVIKLLWGIAPALYQLLRMYRVRLLFLDKVTKLLQTLTKLFDFPDYIGYNNIGYVSMAMEVDIYGSKRA